MIAFSKRHYRLVSVIVLISVMFVFTGMSLAVNSMEDLNKELNKAQQPQAESPSIVLSLFKLLVVLGLIVAAAWSIIHLFRRQLGTKMQGTWLKVVDEVMLGQNRGVVLCEVNGRIYALGVTEGQINLLFEIEDHELLEEIHKEGSQEEPTPAPGYVKILRQMFDGRFKTDPVFSSPKGYIHQMQEQTQKIQAFSVGRGHNRGAGEINHDESNSV